jgi:hypothetical protein
MSDLRSAAQQALNSLRGYRREISCEQPCDAERALEAALEHPEQPVDAEAALRFALAQRDWAFKQLHAQPDRREWRGLTEDEIVAIFLLAPTQPAFARAIEAALKERNV